LQLSINLVCVSAVASQSFNSVFNSTYDNYRILYKGTTTATAATNVNLRFRASGVDTTSGYEVAGVQGTNTGTTISAMNQTAATSVLLCFQDNSLPTYTTISLDVFSPFLSVITAGTWQSNSVSGGNMYSRNGSFGSNATVFDGFTLLFPSGNSAGTISIYGYNK
jgi:hypothetical protein